MLSLLTVLKNGDPNRVFEPGGVDSTAEAEPGGFGTRWASGSLGNGSSHHHHSGLGTQKGHVDEGT